MFSKKDAKVFARLAKKIFQSKNGLPLAAFDILVKIVPFVACELVVVSQRGEFLLTYRKDKFWNGWHFPGGLLRYNDTFKKRLAETATRELNVKLESCEFLFPIIYRVPQTPRGHTVSMVFLCRIQGQPKEGRWFKVMPENIIREHRKLWRQARKMI